MWHLKSKFPKYTSFLFGEFFCRIPNNEKAVFLTFDDGPHPLVTPFILDELRKVDAKASFFCTGKNAEAYPEIMTRIAAEGHDIGNHSHSHLNSWKVKSEVFMEDVYKSGKLISSAFFRPPYGKLLRSQAIELQKRYKLILWDVMPEDFNAQKTPNDCFRILKSQTSSGSIIVLHDSEKAFKNLKELLPKSLAYLKEEKRFRLKKLSDYLE